MPRSDRDSRAPPPSVATGSPGRPEPGTAREAAKKSGSSRSMPSCRRAQPIAGWENPPTVTPPSRSRVTARAAPVPRRQCRPGCRSISRPSSSGVDVPAAPTTTRSLGQRSAVGRHAGLRGRGRTRFRPCLPAACRRGDRRRPCVEGRGGDLFRVAGVAFEDRQHLPAHPFDRGLVEARLNRAARSRSAASSRFWLSMRASTTTASR